MQALVTLGIAVIILVIAYILLKDTETITHVKAIELISFNVCGHETNMQIRITQNSGITRDITIKPGTEFNVIANLGNFTIKIKK